MPYSDIDQLFGNFKVNTRDVTLSNGAVVLVRGLTRFELLTNSKDVTETHLIEAKNVSTCMVEPALTVEQVVEWQQKSAPGDLGRITDAIRDLSGLGDGHSKSNVARDGEHGS